MQVCKKGRTGDGIWLLWPICVAGDAKNADLRRQSPGPTTAEPRTCDGRAPDLRQIMASMASFVQKYGYFCIMYRVFRIFALAVTLSAASAGVASAQNAVAAQDAAWQQSITQYIDSQISNGPLKGAVVGVCAMDIAGQSGNDGNGAGNDKGKAVLAYNASTRMLPASNMKLVTTGAALRAFGPEYRFTTGIGYTGTIDKDGTLNGDVYIIGGGDPTIGAADTTAYKADALFWKWKTILSGAGIKRIHGNIIGDGSAWEGGLENPGWEFADTWTYYGTGSSALCFYENTIDLQVSAGAEPGAPVNMTQTYPETPWLKIENKAETGPAGTGNSLYLQTSGTSTNATLTGTYAIDRKPKREQAANKYGALTCAHEFWKNLKATGWEVTGTYGTPDQVGGDGRGTVGGDGRGTAGGDGVTVIGHTQSPTLAQICRKTNWDSDNFYAESIFRAMGEAATGIAVYDSCLVAINEVLEDIVPGAGKGIIQKDGSGLSRSNSVTPEWMAAYLAAMGGNKAFVESLPHPGEGTLNTLKGLSPVKFRIKSGSMGGTLCYSGYVLDQDGNPRISFAIFTGNADARASQVRPALEGLIQLIGKN